VVSVTDPYGRIVGFLDTATFLSSSSSVVFTSLSEPRSRRTTFFLGSAGNRTRSSGSAANLYLYISRFYSYIYEYHVRIPSKSPPFCTLHSHHTFILHIHVQDIRPNIGSCGVRIIIIIIIIIIIV
jgi:hypothetical protein